MLVTWTMSFSRKSELEVTKINDHIMHYNHKIGRKKKSSNTYGGRGMLIRNVYNHMFYLTRKLTMIELSNVNFGLCHLDFGKIAE